MTAKNKLSNRVLSIFLSLVLIISCIPLGAFSAAAAEGAFGKLADPSTIDGWKEFFLPENGSISTENAGGVWMDKSVFTDATEFANMADVNKAGISLKDENGMLVALSAIASNMTITGQSSVATDTMLVLDVSGSMSDSRVADDLARSANSAIAQLLEHPENRVGVILYAGDNSQDGGANDDAAQVLLPLGRYRTARDGNYITYSSGGYNSYERISLDEDVVIDGGTSDGRRPSTRSKAVNGSTYIQKGIILAENQFTADSNVLTDGEKRKPVVVLMADGVPTLATADFTAPDDFTMGMGNTASSNARIAFVTQLSAAYAKARITEKYGTDCLFYTLGLGTGNNQIATNVLNPVISDTAEDSVSVTVKSLWDSYNSNSLPVDGKLQVQSEGSGYNGRVKYEWDDEFVVKIATPLTKNYVNQYFDSSEYTSSGSLEEALEKAFAAIVAEIELQSAYFPTLVQGSEELSGYITFRDNIGKYMEVSDVKGIAIDGKTLFSGADLARNFIPTGGALGTEQSPTALGSEMLNAVQQRIGIQYKADAIRLIESAYYHNQLYYDASNPNDIKFSNYIGWFADSTGAYIAPWYEGIAEVPANATTIMKSYGYLGEVNAHSKSDMMYASVQVREDIASGEQTVNFAVPAALIPTVTYSVTLDGEGTLKSLKAGGATAPINLIYEVALDSSINEFTLSDIVSQDYINNNSNADGSVNFYTNQYETGNTTGYETVNAFSYFRPSRENDRYYYQTNSMVYTDDRGTLYVSDDGPTGEKYHAYTVYTLNGNELETIIRYHTLTEGALETAHKIEETQTWYIPTGDVRRDYAGFVVNKTQNKTGTLDFSAAPFTDVYGHSIDDTNHMFVVGATLGNNGKVRVMPQTGIKITKELDASATATDKAFNFRVENTSNAADNSAYPAYKTAADGTAADTTVKFENGVAAVALKAGEALIIGGMNSGDVITVEEIDDVDYIVKSVNGDQTAHNATITVAEDRLQTAAFVNADRQEGNLYITKQIEHPFGASYSLPDKSFEITVKLSGVGTANASFETEIMQPGGIAAGTTVTTDASGNVNEPIYLKNGQRFVMYGLPAGTEATVKEVNIANGFTAQYWENGVLEASADMAQVEIPANGNAAVIIVNNYVPEKVYPVNIEVDGTKILEGRAWESTDKFEFMLQKYIPATEHEEGYWKQVGDRAQVLGTQTDKSFSFDDYFGAKVGSEPREEYTEAGTYYYRVIEIEPPINAVEGVSYDKTVHSFAVKVTDNDMDGQLEIVSVTPYDADNTIVTGNAESGFKVSANFKNKYSETGSTQITIDIQKTVVNESNSDKATLDGFEFGLFRQGEDTAAYRTLPTNGLGTTGFVIDDLDVGTHEFTLKEIIPERIPYGWHYSDKSVDIVIEVKSEEINDVIHKSAVVYKAGNTANATDSISEAFENIYDPSNAPVDISFVRKALSGREIKDGEFNFAVYRYNGGNPYEETIATGKNTLEKDEDGNYKVKFQGFFIFDKVGTEFFDIVETSVDGNGVKVDKTVHRIAFTVRDVGGNLEADYILTNGGNTAVFKNSYSPKAITNAVSGTKNLLGGRILRQNDFEFVLVAADENGNRLDGAQEYKVGNAADQSITFPEITYTNEGVYNYLVCENQTEIVPMGVKYDRTKYLVRVTITDNTDIGELEKTVEYFVKPVGESEFAPAEDGIVFNNSYKAFPADGVVLRASKELSGRELEQDDVFTFRIEDEDGTEIDVAQNNQNGEIVFKELNFDEVGTYIYYVSEVNDEKGGIEYDETVYTVRIDVTDDYLGKLKTNVSIFDDNEVPYAEMEFVNSYEITEGSGIILGGQKILEGRDLADDEFTFELYTTNEAFEIADGQTPDLTATNKEGKYQFPIEYTAEQAGQTKFYLIKEKNGGETVDGVIYSDVEYKIEVRLSDNKLGGIRPTVIVHNDGDIAPDELDFVNKLAPKNPEVPETPKVPDAPKTPEAPEKPQAEQNVPPAAAQQSSPKTGYGNELSLLVALLFVSGGVFAAVGLKKKKA